MKDMDGNSQLALPIGEGDNVPSPHFSKRALALKRAWLASVLEAGEADYKRYIMEQSTLRHIASYKNYQLCIVDGVVRDVRTAKFTLAWGKKWESQRHEIAQQIREIDRQIALIEGTV